MDVVVTVPKDRWAEWLAEGELAGDGSDTGVQLMPLSKSVRYGFVVPTKPQINTWERVYVVSHGLLRGYAPLRALNPRGELYGGPMGSFALVRTHGAVAVTLRAPEGGHLAVPGFRGFRYRWWPYAQEMSFPGWKTEGVQAKR